MSRIVKSFSVVDDRSRKPGEPSGMEVRVADKRVIKGGVLDHYGFTFQDRSAAVAPDALLDEINRLRVQVEEEKTALRAVRREMETAQEEHRKMLREMEEALEEADVLDDEVYQSRIDEIEAMRADFEAERAAMREEAEREAKAVHDRSRATGYREGYKSGMAEAEDAFRQEAEPQLQELSRVITELSGYGRELMQEKEKEFVELAVAVAEKVIAREIQTDPDCIVDMLRDLVAKNYRETYINISLSPDMLPARAGAADEVIAKLESLNPNLSVYVEKDAEGLLAAETPKGVADLSVDVQLDNIREALLVREEE